MDMAQIFVDIWVITKLEDNRWRLNSDKKNLVNSQSINYINTLIFYLYLQNIYFSNLESPFYPSHSIIIIQD